MEQFEVCLLAKQYRIRIHAARHMIEEGFSEQDIIRAVTGKGKLLENYPDELRCLILGYFAMGEKLRCPLHIVCDYSKDELVDIVTAYVPEKPWWTTPTKRGRAS